MAEVSTRDAAQILGVTQSRVRALVSAGTLDARRVGDRLLLNQADVERHRNLVVHGATSRAMSSRIAWGAAAILDGHHPDWLSATEQYRLKRRILDAAARINQLTNRPANERATDRTAHVFRRWLSTRFTTMRRYRIADRDLNELLASDGVVATGISAATTYRTGLAGAGQGDAYVSARTHRVLVNDYFLIESARGTLTLREVSGPWHEKTAHTTDTGSVASRLMVGVDLADADDRRSQAAGNTLIADALADFYRATHDTHATGKQHGL